MKYKDNYKNIINRVKLPKVIDDNFINNFDISDQSNRLLFDWWFCGQDLRKIDLGNLLVLRMREYLEACLVPTSVI